MNVSAPPRPVRWLRIAAVLAPLALMFALAFTPGITFTEDLGRHLLLGRIMLETRTVPATNLLTYTHPDFPFVNHHWFFECAVAALHPRLGLNGLIALKAFWFCVALALAMRAGVLTLPCQSGVRMTPMRLAWAGLLAAILLGYRAHLRPEMFSFLFMGCLLWLIEATRRAKDAPGRLRLLRLAVLPVMVIWVNSHIYFMFGLGMLGALGLERWLAEPSWRRIRTEALWFGAALAACLFNPRGLAGLLYPLTIMSNYGVNIVENDPPWKLAKMAINPMLIALPVFAALMLWALVRTAALAFSVRRLPASKRCRALAQLRPANLIIALAGFVASCMMARHAPLFALGALPVIAADPRRPSRRNPPDLAVAALPALAVAVLLTGAAVTGAYSRVFRAPIAPSPFGLDAPGRYEGLRAFWRDNALAGPVITDFNIGSFVEWSIYPEPAYIDNRPEAYPGAFWRDEYYPAMSSPEGFELLASERGIEAAVFSLWIDMIPIAFDPALSPGWALVYIDEFTALWLRRDARNADAIAAHEITPERLASMARLVSEDLLKLDEIPFWRRPVEAERIVFKLYAITRAGGGALARPYLEQILVDYPRYDMTREALRAAAL